MSGQLMICAQCALHIQSPTPCCSYAEIQIKVCPGTRITHKCQLLHSCGWKHPVTYKACKTNKGQGSIIQDCIRCKEVIKWCYCMWHVNCLHLIIAIKHFNQNQLKGLNNSIQFLHSIVQYLLSLRSW